MELSIIIPCLDESGTVGSCVSMARQALDRNSIEGEVIVIDNGSCDESAEAGTNSGARVIPEHRKGYGNALRAGIEQARGTYIIMGDADGRR